MKRTGLLVAIGFTFLVALVLAKPATAICWCESFNDTTTTENWGMGATCTDAHSDLVSHVRAEAIADCGIGKVCFGTVVVVTPCWEPSPGTKQEDGYMEYSCKVCGPINP